MEEYVGIIGVSVNSVDMQGQASAQALADLLAGVGFTGMGVRLNGKTYVEGTARYTLKYEQAAVTSAAEECVAVLAPAGSAFVELVCLV